MSDVAGRSCPAGYGYGAAVFRRAPDFAANTLYVIGGLYGNPQALDQIERLAAQEPVAGVPASGRGAPERRCPVERRLERLGADHGRHVHARGGQSRQDEHLVTRAQGLQQAVAAVAPAKARM